MTVFKFKTRSYNVQTPAADIPHSWSSYYYYFFRSNFLLKLFDQSLSLSLRYNPECCIFSVCCFMCSLRKLYSTVLCYHVIHHTAATCNHFYHWYNVKQLLNTTRMLETADVFAVLMCVLVFLEIIKPELSGDCGVKA